MDKRLRLDELGRKGYRILQDPDAFCFGVDAVLLADFADISAGGRVLDLGTGNGILGFTGYLGAGLQSLVYGFVIHFSGWRMVFFSIAVLLLLSAGLSVLSGRPISHTVQKSENML